jgi:hypothetical protein
MTEANLSLGSNLDILSDDFGALWRCGYKAPNMGDTDRPRLKRKNEAKHFDSEVRARKRPSWGMRVRRVV